MTYYINPIWFYLMNVSNDLKLWCLIASFLIVIACSIIALCIYYYTIDREETKKEWKVFKKLIIIGALFIFLFILLPSKKTCIEMMVASQVTHENVENVKEEVYSIIDYIENYDHHSDIEDE